VSRLNKHKKQFIKQLIERKICQATDEVQIKRMGFDTDFYVYRNKDHIGNCDYNPRKGFEWFKPLRKHFKPQIQHREKKIDNTEYSIADLLKSKGIVIRNK